MNLARKLGIIFIVALFSTSCGGGASSSGSGIGGTGITLVRGNVSSIDGQFFAIIKSDDSQQTVAYLAEWIIPLSYAQSTNPGSLTVSGGGQSTGVNSSGEFELAGVTPSSNFVLTFVPDGNKSISLGIGEVLKGATVTVKNIAIDTKDSSAKPVGIEVKEPVEIEDDISEDPDSNTEDDVSEDSVEDDISEDNPEDDTSEDQPEDEEDSDDSIDDDSNDDEK